MREWLSWWSTTLPRSGSRVRVPSRALKKQERERISVKDILSLSCVRVRPGLERFSVSTPFRSSQNKRPLDVLRRLALSKNKKEKGYPLKISFLFLAFESGRDSNGSRSPLRSGRRRTNVHWTFLISHFFALKCKFDDVYRIVYNSGCCGDTAMHFVSALKMMRG